MFATSEVDRDFRLTLDNWIQTPDVASSTRGIALAQVLEGVDEDFDDVVLDEPSQNRRGRR